MQTAVPIPQDPILSELERLTEETFRLWDEVRVGFSWRSYYMDHTLRVRANSLSVGGEEGADRDLLAYAATLHDITKRYDGPLKTDANGQRVVNADGFWLNDPLMPARQNEVTEIYDRLNLYSTVHHDSGAEVAKELLARRGLSKDFREQVAHIIRGHLRSPNPPWTLGGPDDPHRDPESCALFDADTIDANLGLIAFYRFIQIHCHRLLQKGEEIDLKAFIDQTAGWVQRKEEFVKSRLTETGREVAWLRYRYNQVVVMWLQRERASDEVFKASCEYGVLSLIRFFLRHNADPNMRDEMKQVKRVHLPRLRRAVESGKAPAPAAEALARAEAFVRLIDDEISGVLSPREVGQTIG